MGRSCELSLSDLVTGFFEELEGGCWEAAGDDDNVGEGSSCDKNKAFWETHRQLLQEALAKPSSTENRVRADTEEAVRAMQSGGREPACSCSIRPAVRECRTCTLRHIAERLRAAGYNSALCRSKWRRSPDIPSGEHSYLDVVMESRNGKKKGPVRVVIELNFRAEFEMARASREYGRLVHSLPKVFVGKGEKLKAVVKIMCEAAKRCARENKMHMGPWRKHEYMQSKWLGTPERAAPGFSIPVSPTAAAAAAERQPKPRASMLTFDLHRTAVEVV